MYSIDKSVAFNDDSDASESIRIRFETLLRELPNCNRAGHVHIQTSDNSKLGNLEALVHDVQILGWYSFFFFSQQ